MEDRIVKLTELPFRSVGGQPAFEPHKLEPFVSAPRIAVLSYVKRDGTPAQAPIWYRYDDGRFFMVTAKGSPKAKALARAGRASLAIQDDMPPYRAVIVDGEVTLSDVAVEGGVNHWLATRYFGRIGGSEYEKMTAEANHKGGLSLIRFEPLGVRGFDNHRLVGRGLRLYMRVREILPVPREWF